MSHSLPETQQ